jgi:hypothetical protein
VKLDGMKWVLTRNHDPVLVIVAALEALVGLHLELGQVSLQAPISVFYSFVCFNFLFLSFEIYLELVLPI